MNNSNYVLQLIITSILVFATIIFIIAPLLMLLVIVLLNFALSLNLILTYWQLVALGAAVQLLGALLAPTLRSHTKIN
jgi:uncharacterized membrane protein